MAFGFLANVENSMGIHYTLIGFCQRDRIAATGRSSCCLLCFGGAMSATAPSLNYIESATALEFVLFIYIFVLHVRNGWPTPRETHAGCIVWD